MKLTARPGSRPRRPDAFIAEQAMEVQCAVGDVERIAAPLWPAALRSARPAVIASVRRLAALLRRTRNEARELAGVADQVEVAA